MTKRIFGAKLRLFWGIDCPCFHDFSFCYPQEMKNLVIPMTTVNQTPTLFYERILNLRFKKNQIF